MRSPQRHPFVHAVRGERRRSRSRRRARWAALGVAALALAGGLTSFWPRAEAAANGTYRDEFAAVSYGGSSGTLAWSSPWEEIGEANGPGSGRVTVGVWSGRCATGNCLRINDETAGAAFGVQRSADLAGAGAATLTFSYTLEQDNPGGSTFVLEAAPSASGPWTTLETYVVSGTHTAPIPQAFDLTPFIGAETTIRVVSDGAGLSNEFYLDDVQIEAVPTWRTRPALWFSIRDDTTSGPPALPALKDGAIASFSDPGLNYQPGATTGTLGIIADWDAAFASLDLRGLHLVGTAMTVGGVNLQPGDLLFTVGGDTSLPGASGSVTVKMQDVGRFRPASPGDYTAGTFSVLLQNPLGSEVRGVTVAEQDTRVGEVTLATGTFLLIRSGESQQSDVYRYVVSSAGPGSTSGTVSKLLEGTEMGFSDQIWGIDLIEEGMGWPFPRGAIVLTVEKGVLVGIDGLAAPKRTLFSVIVARTSLAGTARVNAILAWDGNDLGLDEDKERLDGFTLGFLDYPPVFDGDAGDRDDPEGASISFSATATDPLGGAITYSATGLPPGITYGATSGVVSGWIDYTAAAGSPYAVTLTATDPGGNTATDTFVWTVQDVNRPPEVKDHDDLSSAEGDVVSVALIGFDPDDDPVTWTATGLPPGLTIDPVTGLVSGTIPYDASPGSPYTVTVRLTDEGTPSLWVEDGFVWTVADTNRAPVLVDPGPQSHAEGEVVSLTVVGSDPDGDDLVWLAFGLPPGLAISQVTGVISGTLSYEASVGSPHEVQVRAYDEGSPTMMTAVFFGWSVTDTNRAPVVTNPGDRLNVEGDPVTFAMAGSDPDGDTLTWSATGLPPGLGIDPATGVISGTLTFEAAGSHAVVLRATDDGTPSLFTDVAFSWTVTDTNRAPLVAVPVDRSDAEGDLVSLEMVGSDPDLDPLTWSATGLPPGLTITPTTGLIAGEISYAASPASPYTVTVRATDDGTPALFTEVSFLWAVSDTNRAPSVAHPGDRSNAEGDPVTFALEGVDPDDDTLTWSATGLPPGLGIDPESGVISGVLTYAASDGSPHLITVRVDDDGVPALFGEVTFSWVVADTNRTPVVTPPGNQASAEGEGVVLPISGFDADGDGLTWSASGLPPGLTIGSADGVISGTVTYDAAPGSPYAVTVLATDDGSPSLSTEVTFSWVVANTNRAPIVASPGDRIGAEGDAVALAMVGSDPDGDTLTWSATGLPPGLGIDGVTGVISGTISYDAAGVHPVTVRATDDDPEARFTEVSFTWTVTNTNRAPVVADPGAQANAEGEAITLVISGSDPDGDTLTWSATGLPPGLSISAGAGVISGSISYEAAPGSPYTVAVRATDDDADSLFAETTFTWTVANTNRAPIVTTPANRSDAEGEAVSMAVPAVDPDGNGMTWSATGLPGGMTISSTTGVIAGTLSYVAAGTHQVTVRVTDDGSPILFTEVSFTWTVADTNRAPIVVGPVDQSAAEGAAIAMPISGHDPDGDTLTWSATGLPPGLTISTVTGTISGTLSYSAAGVHPVTVRATDDGSPVLFSEVSFTWTVANTNRAPVVTSPASQSHAEGQTISLAVVGSDPDDDGLTWSASGLPDGLAISAATGTISGVLSFSAAGTHAVTVRATDDDVASAFTEVTFSWVVANTNRAPTLFNPGDQTASEGDTVNLAIVASDPDGDGIMFAATGLPSGLAISPTTGVVSGSLGYAHGDQYAVTVTATDDGSPPLQSVVVFTWMIAEVNRPPILAPIADRTSEQGVAESIVPSVTEPDGDRITWSVAGLPAGVGFSADSGTISGTPSIPGVYGVSVTATDNGLPPASHTRSFTWTVAAAPGFPVISGIDSRRDREGDLVSLNAIAAHPSGLAMTWSAEGLPGGVRIDAASGRLRGFLDAPGTWFSRVTVTDSRGQAATTSFVWVVESARDLAPIAHDDEVRLAIDDVTDGGIALDAVGNDIDPEGMPLQIVSVGPVSTGTVEIVDGMVVFFPPRGWMGTVTFPYVVADPAGNRDEGMIRITVEDSLAIRLGAVVLTTDPGPGVVDLGALAALTPSAGTEVLLGSLFESLYVLRVPLALLGGAVFWSLLLGGILNLGFVLRGGFPRLVRRTSRRLAVVMVPQGGRVDVLTEPRHGALLGRLTATQRGIEATGRRVVEPDGTDWAEIRLEAGLGWAPGVVLTEEVDRAGFAADPEVDQLVAEFVVRLRVRRDFTDLVSQHGLFVAHHAPLIHYPPEALPGLMDDPGVRAWKGRNPAYPDFSGTFDLAVATGVLDAMDHPRREILPDTPAVPSTLIPVEFTNYHFVAIGADLHGPERLDQSAWMIMIAYEAARPRIIGLVREG